MRLHDEGQIRLQERMLEHLRLGAQRFATHRAVQFCRHDLPLLRFDPCANSNTPNPARKIPRFSQAFMSVRRSKNEQTT